MLRKISSADGYIDNIIIRNKLLDEYLDNLRRTF